MKKLPQRITVGELIEHLRGYDESFELDFQGLDFYRLKQRAPRLVQFEFEQIVSFDSKARTWAVRDP